MSDWSGWSGVDTPQTLMTTRAPEVLNKVLKKATLAVCNQPTPVQREMYTTQTSKMSYNVIIRIVNCIAYALSMSTF